jgi:Raf kinase inhibitor-like YbhB/YbcL family protein
MCGTCGIFISMAIEVSSPAFDQGGIIPTKYTGEGQDVSPALNWSDLPEGTREIALVCDDPDAPRPEPWVHWVLYKIPADSTGLPEGGTEGALEGENDFGRRGYGGPMPPVGHGVHHYHFKVYALDAELERAAGLTKDQLLEAMEGHVLDEGKLVGTYERK